MKPAGPAEGYGYDGKWQIGINAVVRGIDFGMYGGMRCRQHGRCLGRKCRGR